MGKWLGPAANKITLGRIPCLALIFSGVFCLGRGNLAWFWFGGVAMIIGMFLDWLDGFWARKITKKPTKEGQFLDQLVDKVFVWPIWIVGGAAHWNDLAWYWYPLSAWLLWLDMVSCRRHYRTYQADCLKGAEYFDASHGAVWPGKWKFFCENVVNCILVGSLCPSPGEGNEWWQHISTVIGDGGRGGYKASVIFLLIALLLANWSLLKRKRLALIEMVYAES